MEQTGDLAVSMDSGSGAVRHNMPYVVRDSRLALVHQGTVGEQPISLAEGLYSVDVLAPSGALTTSVVHVRPGATAQVEVAGPETPERTLAPGFETSLDSVLGDAMPETTLARGQLTEFRFDKAPSEDQLVVLESSECSVNRHSYDVVEIEPDPVLDAVPTARFQLGAAQIVMSLPLNPLGYGRARGCFVARNRGRESDQLAVLFAPDRDLVSVMFGLLQHGTAHSASSLFDAATELLRGKYVDPAGAALGGLTLHGMGLLANRRDWVKNLADDFPWLPDGKILCAAVLMKDDEESNRSLGWDLLLSATLHRPLYTDGLSVAMELLRRWPPSVPGADDMCTERLQRLGRLAAHAQWDSIVLMTHGQ